jgi:hypothetical protein
VNQVGNHRQIPQVSRPVLHLAILRLNPLNALVVNRRVFQVVAQQLILRRNLVVSQRLYLAGPRAPSQLANPLVSQQFSQLVNPVVIRLPILLSISLFR